eukprot:tig00020902_g14959.t1
MPCNMSGIYNSSYPQPGDASYNPDVHPAINPNTAMDPASDWYGAARLDAETQEVDADEALGLDEFAADDFEVAAEEAFDFIDEAFAA